jgi:serine/threonine protein kinase
MLRELGSRPASTWAALESIADGRTQLVVVERAARGGSGADPEIADWVRDAKRLATLEHPNVARVRDVVIRSDEVIVATEFVDGVTWAQLSTATPPPSLEVALRVLVDVLTGLAAVHNLRDAARVPLKLVHGALTPRCVIVGVDGVSRVVGAARLHSPTALRQGRESAHLAPEVLLADDSADARADTYSVGVMLWEALTGRPLFPNMQPSAIVTHLLSGRVPRATAPDGLPWAAPLVDVAARALSPDPQKRFESASAMAAELRRVAGTRLPAPVRAAALVRATFGDRIQARRDALERGETHSNHVSPVDSPTSRDSVPVDIDVDVSRMSSASTPAPPPVSETAPTKPPPELHPGPAAVTKLAPAPLPRLVLAQPPPARLANGLIATPPMRPPVRTLNGMVPPPPPALPPAPTPAAAAPAQQPPVTSIGEIPTPLVPIVARAAGFVPTAPPIEGPGPSETRPRRTIVLVASAAAAALFAMGALAWWVESRPPSPRPAASTSEVAMGTETTIAIATPTATRTTTTTTTATATATATATTTATPTPTPDRTEGLPRASTPSPPWNATPPRPRTSTRRTYEPEGI